MSITASIGCSHMHASAWRSSPATAAGMPADLARQPAINPAERRRYRRKQIATGSPPSPPPGSAITVKVLHHYMPPASLSLARCAGNEFSIPNRQTDFGWGED
jgi:hypothetical protein